MQNTLEGPDTKWGFDRNARDRVLIVQDESGRFSPMETT